MSDPKVEPDIEPASISVLGLGIMGTVIAGALLATGAPLAVWNRSPEKTEVFRDTGAKVCASPREAIAAGELVIVCLTSYAAWDNLVADAGLEDLLGGRTLVQLTTGTRAEAREHAARARRWGAGLVDGVILAFPSQIGTEEAMLLTAGEADAWARSASTLDALGGNVRYLGTDVGGPSVLDAAMLSSKLGTLIGTIHGAALAEAGGVSLHELHEVLDGTRHINSDEMLRVCEAIATGRTEQTEAALGTWGSIPGHMLDLARSSGTDPSFPEMLQRLFARAEAAGLGEHDLSAMVQLFRARH